MSAFRSPRHPPPTQIETAIRLHIGYRVGIGLIALSLSMMSLALGLAFIRSPAALLVVAPAASTTVHPTTATAVTIQWTVPEWAAGQSLEWRYADFPLTSDNLPSAQIAPGMFKTLPVGSRQSLTVTNLKPDTTYFFALAATDAQKKRQIVTVVTQTTAPTRLGCVPKYECSAWTGCGDGLQSRTCSAVNDCAAGLNRPIIEQQCFSTRTGAGLPVAIRNPIWVAGVGPGTRPLVRIINPRTGSVAHEFLAFNRSNRNGTNVATGDINGDGAADVLVGSGAGADAVVKLFTGTGTFVTEFHPYPASDQMGVEVAVDDIDGDGTDEILTIPAKGPAQLRVFEFENLTKEFSAVTQSFVYPRTVQSGFTLATGDLNLDGRADIVIAPRANGQTVTVMNYTTDGMLIQLARLDPFRKTVPSGLTVAVADTNGDGQAEIVTTGGPGGGSHVKILTLDGRLQAQFQPVKTTDRTGLELAAYDVNTDGREDILIAPYASGDPHLRIFSYDATAKDFNVIQDLAAYPRTMQSGLRLDAAPRI